MPQSHRSENDLGHTKNFWPWVRVVVDVCSAIKLWYRHRDGHSASQAKSEGRRKLETRPSVLLGIGPGTARLLLLLMRVKPGTNIWLGWPEKKRCCWETPGINRWLPWPDMLKRCWDLPIITSWLAWSDKKRCCWEMPGIDRWFPWLEQLNLERHSTVCNINLLFNWSNPCWMRFPTSSKKW